MNLKRSFVSITKFLPRTIWLTSTYIRSHVKKKCVLKAIHEIKRRLFLGRITMTNLDSLLKSRDITLPIKVRLVKAMVFPMSRHGMSSNE